MSRKTILRCLAVALLAAAVTPSAIAEDVTKKWRVSFAAGGFNSQAEIDSNSKNLLLTYDPCIRTLSCPVGIDNFQFLTAAFRDPRNDSSAFGSLGLEASTIGTAAVQYAITNTLVVEGSIGYQTGDIGNAEVSVQFEGDAPPIEEIDYNFRTYHVPVGEMTRVPIQLTGLARFRPRARFNPYFGAGIGYDINGFQPSSEFNELSRTMDSLRGQQMRVTSILDANGGSLAPLGVLEDLSGASVDVRDSFAWHLVSGAEFSLKRNWALFLDLRWVDASRDLSVSFNGSEELGRSVPNFSDYNDSPLATSSYGPVRIFDGGLVDAGELLFLPKVTAPVNTDCADSPNNCELTFILAEEFATRLPEGFVPNGLPDSGDYYVQGGRFAYDGFALQFGFRYTFK